MFFCLFFISTPHSVLQSIVDLSFQYTLSPFLMVSDHCMPVSSPHNHVSQFYMCCSPFSCSSIVAVAVCFGAFVSFILTALPYHLNWRDFMSFAVLPPLMHPLSSCFFVFSSILLLLRFHIFSLKSVFVPLFSHPCITTEIHHILGRELEVLALAHVLVLHSWQ